MQAVPAPMFSSVNNMDMAWMPVYVDLPSSGDQVDCTFSKATGLLQSIRYSAW